MELSANQISSSLSPANLRAASKYQFEISSKWRTKILIKTIYRWRSLKPKCLILYYANKIVEWIKIAEWNSKIFPNYFENFLQRWFINLLCKIFQFFLLLWIAFWCLHFFWFCQPKTFIVDTYRFIGDQSSL